MKRKIKFNSYPKSIIAIYIALAVAISTLIDTTVNNDAWFLLNSGRYILANGIPYTEVFSMHAGMHGIMQQWLSDVIFWILYSRLGAVGIMLVLCVVFALCAFLIYKICRIVSDNVFVSCAVATVMLALTAASFFTIRPQIFTIAIMLTAIIFLELYAKRGNAKYLIPIPFLSVLEINIHASMWVVLFVLMLPYIADSFDFNFKIIKCAGIKKAPLFITFIVSLVCGLLNPYGLEAMTYLTRSYNLKNVNEYVNEMQPLSFSQLKYVVMIMLIAVAVVLIVTNLTEKRCSVPMRYVLLVGGFGYMMMTSYRNAMFFLPLAFFTVSFCLRNVQPYICVDSKEGDHREVAKKIKSIITVFIVAFFAIVVGYYSVNAQDIYQSASGVSDSKGAVAYISDNYNEDDISAYTSYADGSYAEYMGIKCYIDSRAEVYYKSNNKKADIFDEYYEMQNGMVSCKKILDKYKFDILLVGDGDILSTYLPEYNDYIIVYKDKNRTVYQRADITSDKLLAE